MHHTPTGASWMNLVEIFFGILTRQAIRRGSFTSVPDLEALLAADPEWVTCIDITVEKELPDGSGYLCCGEASHGSEGFFGRLDRNKNLVRVYLQDSNPFIEAVLDTTHATVTSSSEVSITVDLTSPEFGPAQSS
jgi:hypothetical protein